MALNIFGANSIAMRTALASFGNAGATVVEVVTGSGAAKKLSSIIASNASVVEVSIKLTIARGAAETTLVAPTIVEASSSVILLDRDTPIYLEDGDSLKAYTITTGATAEVICSYEEVT
jgi:hypothetical protein